jgi:ABC-type branched-subunit amino acid transport system substrate-binding protein
MRAGVQAWARDRGWELLFENDESSPYVEARHHELLEQRGCRFVIGPYGSDTTRALARARDGKVVWNHGGAADDVQVLPGVVSVSTPASRYLVALARAAAELGAQRIAVRTARGRFARLAREGLERELETVPEDEADCVLLCGPVEWEAKQFPDLLRRGVLLGGVSPGLPHEPWPDGTLAPVQWHPDLGGPDGVHDYVAAQAYAVALIAERCLELEPADPLAAARSLSTSTFFGAFELDETGLQVGHRLSIVRWRGGRQELVGPSLV